VDSGLRGHDARISELLLPITSSPPSAGAQVGLVTVNLRNPPFYANHGYAVVAHDTDEPSGVRRGAS